MKSATLGSGARRGLQSSAAVKKVLPGKPSILQRGLRLLGRGLLGVLRIMFQRPKLSLGVILGLLSLYALTLLFSSRNTKEPGGALANLRTLQHTWWDMENLANGCKDPSAALARLQEQQRGWWENEGLALDGDASGARALQRLEEMQREWFMREGLESGKPVKDAGGPLARLEAISRQWWKSEGAAQARIDVASNAEKDDPADKIATASNARLDLIDQGGTRRFLQAGGTRESEEAVQLGLRWLATQQQLNGSWPGKGQGEYSERAGQGDMVGTAFGVWPFLARGETHKGSQDINTYTKVVENGLKFLLARQKPNGDLRDPTAPGSGMYIHGLLSIVLCEAFGFTADPTLRGPCQRAIDFIVKAQDPVGGGWRYEPQESGDISVTSWQLMALKSGQLAGLIVPRETLDKASRFLKQCAAPNDDGYGYLAFVDRGELGGAPRLTRTTALGLLCRQFLQSNDDIRSARMIKGVDRLLAVPPAPQLKDLYYYYYATQVVFNVGGEPWKQWNPKMRDLLVTTQDKSSSLNLRGSWDPAGDNFCGAGGRAMSTSLALLTLEIYYRHLPLNRPELGEMAKDIDTRATSPGPQR
jgi:hypothetical protein